MFGILGQQHWSETVSYTHLDVYKRQGNEVEVTIYDKVNDRIVPVAVMWLLLADIAEEIRKKKVGQQQKQGKSHAEWMQASRLPPSQPANNTAVITKDLPQLPDAGIPTEDREANDTHTQSLTCLLYTSRCV